MLREAVAARTPLGLEAKRYMDQGALVPDDVIIGAMAERMAKPDAKRGFLLDGFPRTIGQAQALGTLLEGLGQPLARVIFFDVTEAELLRRLTGRRVCRSCGATYHLVSAPSARADVCDRCGGGLYQRPDDSEATVRHRLQVYATQTAPLLDYYRQRNLLSTVRGEGAIEGIGAALRQVLAGTR
jgi:adenylate kinase